MIFATSVAWKTPLNHPKKVTPDDCQGFQAHLWVCKKNCGLSFGVCQACISAFFVWHTMSLLEFFDLVFANKKTTGR